MDVALFSIGVVVWLFHVLSFVVLHGRIVHISSRMHDYQLHYIASCIWIHTLQEFLFLVAHKKRHQKIRWRFDKRRDKTFAFISTPL